ncbi:unnamed protein product [Cuscuta campestris]|uniref:WRKY domain-containing protein n=1 Tax=Cuscuta campestris TaxID=132261 RepID=A0A484LXI6_9ASTE|nr:unnamed protein product [Cuscuta campestris]
MEKESENLLRVCRKRVVSDLLKGREMATRLQTLLQRSPGTAAEGLSGSSPSVHSKLSLEIFRSFSDAISQLNNCCAAPPPPGRQRGILLSNDSDDGQKFWLDEPARKRVQENGASPPGRTGRGGYKRRKNSGEETRTNVCKTMEDGYAWRKYGQKHIHNSLHPRCTQKGREGCKATKQVQRISQDEFQTTYFGHHTCIHSHNPSNKNHQHPREHGGDLDDDSCSSCLYCNDDHRRCNQNAAEAEEEESPLAVAATYHPHRDMGGVVDDDDVDYERCFENLDNLFRSEEMPLAFLDDKD